MTRHFKSTAACTSVVVDSGPAGVPVHVRTMDWNMLFDLRPMIVNVEFWEHDRFAFAATTWAGFVGIFTGMRADGFSISVNYRLCGGSVLRKQIEKRGFWRNSSAKETSLSKSV